jgi:hypothetical protein
LTCLKQESRHLKRFFISRTLLLNNKG